jgi:hypothetical protein
MRVYEILQLPNGLFAALYIPELGIRHNDLQHIADFVRRLSPYHGH